jgi:hypothetical protein
MYKKVVRIVFSVIVSLLLITQPVFAGGGKPPKYDYTITGPNGELYYVDVFEIVGEANFPAKDIQAHEALAAGGCKSITYGTQFYNANGQIIIKYSQKVDWCYDGTKVTSVSHTKTPTVYIPTWRYNGLINHTHSGGVGQTSYRAYSQASFCSYIATCVWYLYPWVDETVRGNGTFSGSSGF